MIFDKQNSVQNPQKEDPLQEQDSSIMSQSTSASSMCRTASNRRSGTTGSQPAGSQPAAQIIDEDLSATTVNSEGIIGGEGLGEKKSVPGKAEESSPSSKADTPSASKATETPVGNKTGEKTPTTTGKKSAGDRPGHAFKAKKDTARLETTTFFRPQPPAAALTSSNRPASVPASVKRPGAAQTPSSRQSRNTLRAPTNRASQQSRSISPCPSLHISPLPSRFGSPTYAPTQWTDPAVPAYPEHGAHVEEEPHGEDRAHGEGTLAEDGLHSEETTTPPGFSLIVTTEHASMGGLYHPADTEEEYRRALAEAEDLQALCGGLTKAAAKQQHRAFPPSKKEQGRIRNREKNLEIYAENYAERHEKSVPEYAAEYAAAGHAGYAAVAAGQAYIDSYYAAVQPFTPGVSAVHGVSAAPPSYRPSMAGSVVTPVLHATSIANSLGASASAVARSSLAPSYGRPSGMMYLQTLSAMPYMSYEDPALYDRRTAKSAPEFPPPPGLDRDDHKHASRNRVEGRPSSRNGVSVNQPSSLGSSLEDNRSPRVGSETDVRSPGVLSEANTSRASKRRVNSARASRAGGSVSFAADDGTPIRNTTPLREITPIRETTPLRDSTLRSSMRDNAARDTAVRDSISRRDSAARYSSRRNSVGTTRRGASLDEQAIANSGYIPQSDASMSNYNMDCIRDSTRDPDSKRVTLTLPDQPAQERPEADRKKYDYVKKEYVHKKEYVVHGLLDDKGKELMLYLPPLANGKTVPPTPANVGKYSEMIASDDPQKNLEALHVLTNQSGSRAVQQWIPLLTTAVVPFPCHNGGLHSRKGLWRKFCSLCAEHAVALAQDAFANYSLQQVIEACDVKTAAGRYERNMILSAFLGYVAPLANSRYGCRVIGAVLPMATLELRSKFIREVKYNVVDCAFAQNGNHVVQKMLDYPNVLPCWYSALVGHSVELATHRYGCRVLQKIANTIVQAWDHDPLKEQGVFARVQLFTEEQLKERLSGRLSLQNLDACTKSTTRSGRVRTATPTKSLYVERDGKDILELLKTETEDTELDRMAKYLLLSETTENPRIARDISFDKHGNFVMHHILHARRPTDLYRLTQVVHQDIKAFCCHKFASNIIETLIFVHPPARDMMLGVLGNERDCHELGKHEIGNFVVQKLLKMVTTWQLGLVNFGGQRGLDSLQKSRHGKHMVNILYQRGLLIGQPIGGTLAVRHSQIEALNLPHLGHYAAY